MKNKNEDASNERAKSLVKIVAILFVGTIAYKSLEHLQENAGYADNFLSIFLLAVCAFWIWKILGTKF